MAIRLISLVEREFGREIPVRALFEQPTVEHMAEIIAGSRPAEKDSVVLPIRRQGRMPPLFWVHAAGGLALSFRRLAKYLPEEYPVYVVQQFRSDAERGSQDVVETAARYIQELRSVQPAGPYCLGGLSLGGILAWEMACQLVQAGESVGFLALLDTRGPGLGPSSVWTDPGYWMRQRIEFHRGQLGMRALRAWPGYFLSAFVRVFTRTMRDLSPDFRGRPGPKHHSAPDEVVAAFEQSIRARRAYRPRAYPSRVYLFRARVQPRGYEDPYLGWHKMARGGVEVREVPGTHASIMVEPQIKVLGEQISNCLKEIEASGQLRRSRIGPSAGDL